MTTPNVSFGETIRGKLIQFSVVNELTKTTSTIIAEQLSIEVDAKGDRAFVIDTGNKGKINFDELQIRLHKLDYEIPDGNAPRLMEAVSMLPLSGILEMMSLYSIKFIMNFLSFGLLKRCLKFLTFWRCFYSLMKTKMVTSIMESFYPFVFI